jgi:hypothetical protein
MNILRSFLLTVILSIVAAGLFFIMTTLSLEVVAIIMLSSLFVGLWSALHVYISGD